MYKFLQNSGMFQYETDLAFFLSTDKIQVFIARKLFSATLIIQTCYNLLLWVRPMWKNILPVCFVPEPKKPIDLHSFLEPIVEEFLDFESGIIIWYGSRYKEIWLQAYIWFIGANMMGHQIVLTFMGNRAGSYYEYYIICKLYLKFTITIHFLFETKSNIDCFITGLYSILTLHL